MLDFLNSAFSYLISHIFDILSVGTFLITINIRKKITASMTSKNLYDNIDEILGKLESFVTICKTSQEFDEKLRLDMIEYLRELQGTYKISSTKKNFKDLDSMLQTSKNFESYKENIIKNITDIRVALKQEANRQWTK